MSKSDLTEIVWSRLSEAAAEHLADVDSDDPENVKVVIAALLAMAARSAVVTGEDAEWFARTAKAAFVGSRGIVALEGTSTTTRAKEPPPHWQACFRGGQA